MIRRETIFRISVGIAHPTERKPMDEQKIGSISQTAFLSPESTSVWSFPVRGAWATHNNKYRGNFAPQIARNVIERYSQPGEVVLDPMAGGGTTLIEAKLLGRGFIGCDINPGAVKICEKAVEFRIENEELRIEERSQESTNCKLDIVDCKLKEESRKRHEEKKRVGTAQPADPRTQEHKRPKLEASATLQKIVCADVRDLSFIGDGSVDLILTHPPYLNIIKYSDTSIEGDLSAISSVSKFCDEIEKAARELYRVLKPGKYCAILIGDTRRRRHYVPLAFSVMQRFLKAGFILKEDVVKVQHNCTTTRYWGAQKKDFLLIMHEHLFIFRKPAAGEDVSIYKDSRK